LKKKIHERLKGMHARKLTSLLNKGERIYGTAIVSTSPLWPSVVKQTGIDFVFLDTEHIPLDRHTLSWMCQTYNALNLPSIVRIPNPDPFEACKVLDGCACGIIAPYIESADQVRDLIGATKFRPLKGKRLKKILNGHEAMESELKQYLEERNADTVLWINIESMPTLNSLDEIVAVKGLDGLIIGPHDLSCSMGLPEQYTHPQFEKTVLHIISSARDKSLAVGIHFTGALDLQIKWAKAGANIVLYSSDISLFSQALQRGISQIRIALGEKSEKFEEEGNIII